MQFNPEVFSEEILTLSGEILAGKRRKYDPKLHIPLLLEIYSHGGTKAMFCSDVGIHTSTFDRWLLHKEFGYAYCIAQTRGHAFHDRLGRDNIYNKEFNTTMWSMVGRNRYGQTEHRKLQIKELKDITDLKQAMMIVFSKIADGSVTAAEANILASIVSSAVKVEEYMTDRKTLEEIHSMLKAQESK